ncbi:MAG: hypothetical protein RL481_1994 [Pseudomonadota bacterium]
MRVALISTLLASCAVAIAASSPAATAQTSQAAVTQADISNFIDYYEWHFEARLTPDQRQKMASLVEADLKNSAFAEEVLTKSKFMTDFARKGYFELFSTHNDLKNLDSIDYTTEHIMNGDHSADVTDSMLAFYGAPKREPTPASERKLYGTGVAAMLRHSARDNRKSSAFLLDFVEGYKEPLVGDGTHTTSLFRRDVDATFEWLSFRMIMVAQKRVVIGNDAERQQMERQITETWRKLQSDPNKLAAYRGWLNTNVTDWLMWRGAKYSQFERMTPFGRKEQLARWGAEIAGLSPDMKPFADQRMAEFRTYVAKMPADELKREFELKQRTDNEFQMQMKKIQHDMKSTQQSFAMMRQGLTAMHVTNLNISENIGNTGFVWKIQNNGY